MQVGHKLQFKCPQCQTAVCFSVLDAKGPITCGDCSKKYAFDDNIMRQLTKFEALCRQIHDSEEILGNTAVAIAVDHKEVKIPYRLLLTRLSSVMELSIGDEKLQIAFRVEPLRDVPQFSKELS